MQNTQVRLTKKSPIDYIFYALGAIMLGVLTFHSSSFTIEPESPEVVLIRKSWWGLQEKYNQVKWFAGGWQIKGKDGRWHPFMIDNDSEPFEYIPVR